MAGVIGASVKRKEDRPLLTGRGVFTEDIRLPGMLWAGFVRSPHAHARILNIDAAAALADPRVAAVLTGEDIHPRYRTYPLVAIPGVTGLLDLDHERPPYYLIATGKVRHVGEIVAMVIAKDRYGARDAEELVTVDYEVLPAAVDPEEALRPDAPRVHDDCPNLALQWRRSTANVAQAFEEADVIVGQRIVNQRIHAAPMEPRAGLAHWDSQQSNLTLWASTQTPHDLKTHLAEILDLPQEKVRVVAPDVGGGFGPKAHGDPEYALLAAASLELNAPVKWVASRAEEFVGLSHSRGKASYLELAATSEGRATAVRLRHFADVGAYPKAAEVNLSITSAMICVGAYHIPDADLEVHAAYTNRTPQAPYRGAGRSEGIFLIERAMDLLAGKLGMDPAEVRRLNLTPPGVFPYTTAGGDTYDSGDYPAALDRALALSGYAALREEQREEQAGLRSPGLPSQKRCMGIGLSCWVKSGGMGPLAINPADSVFEWGRVRVDRGGAVTVYTGSSPHGQGLDTTLAQIAAQALSAPVEEVTVLHGDTQRVSYGAGTFGSRSMVVGGTAVHRAASRVREKMVRLAAHLLGASPDDLTLEDGVFTPGDGTGRRLTMKEVAREAWSLRHQSSGLEYGLDESSFFQPAGLTFSYGAYVAVVEVDPETGDVQVSKLFCVDDQGTVVNPSIVEGQVHGGALQGLGQALYEELVYDDAGQLLTGSFMDYALPTAEMAPEFVTARLETPSPFNPLGMKGMGEGPTVGAAPAVVNAVVDALAPFGVTHVEMPLTPERVRRAIMGLD